MTYRKTLLITTAVLALAPFAANATLYTWNTTTGNWSSTTSWSPTPPVGGPSGTTNTAAITGTSTIGAVTVTSSITSLGTGAATGLTLGGGVGFNDTLTINSGVTLTTNKTALQGGTVNGPGTLSSAISGYGTVNAPFTGSVTATGTAGNPLTLTGGFTITGGTMTASGAGGLNVNGDTLSGSSFAASTGAVNLNGATLNGATLNGSNGQFNVVGDSTLKGTISWNQYNTFNIGGTNGAHTLNVNAATLNTVTGGANPFIIGTGGVLSNVSGTSTMGGGGTVTLNGGSITAPSGKFTIGDPISGYGTISGNVDIAGSLTAAGSGKTLTVDGGSGSGLQLGNSFGSGTSMSTSGGATLDLKGNLSLIEPATANPGTGTIQFDGANFTNGSSFNPVSINNSGLTTSGTFDVVGSNTSTLNNVAFSTGNGANLKVDAPLTVTGGGTLNATNVTVNSTGALNLTNTTGTTTLTTNNLTLAKGSTLDVVAGHNGISLTGNFSYQQTDTINGWTNGSTAGLGPDLTMTGKNVTLEAGGAIGGGYSQNFALDSLTLGPGTFVALVNQFANAAQGYGTEAFYVDNLFGVLPGPGVTIPTLNLDGINAYDQSCPLTDVVCGPGGQLSVGLYIDSKGGEINIINDPEPATIAVLGTGLLGLGLIRRRRRN